MTSLVDDPLREILLFFTKHCTVFDWISRGGCRNDVEVVSFVDCRRLVEEVALPRFRLDLEVGEERGFLQVLQGFLREELLVFLVIFFGLWCCRCVVID